METRLIPMRSKWKQSALALWLSLATVGQVQSAALPVCYRVTELDFGNLRNPTNDVYTIYPSSLNDAGAFTGYVYHTNTPMSMLYYSPLTGFVDLGRWKGTGTRGFALNEAGQIAVKGGGGSGKEILLRFTLGVGYEELGNLGGNGPDAEHAPRSINLQGQITGFSETLAGDIHAFRWRTDSGMEDLGTLGGWLSKGLGINDQGWISGTSYGTDGQYHIFIWTSDQGMVDLGLGIGGDINNQGTIIGAQPNGQPLLLYDGQRVPVRTPFGIANYSVGCINEHNLFRGTYWNPNSGVGFTAIIGSERHGIVDLNKLIPTNSDWILTEGDAMNNHCQIVGKGIHQGHSAIFWLDPVVPPLAIQRGGTNVLLSWQEPVFPVEIEESATLKEGSWEPVGGIATNSLTLPMAHSSRFYRLAIPPTPPPPSL
jgi:probable HAF family extracellular repeat protein